MILWYIVSTSTISLLQSMMILGQEKGILVTETTCSCHYVRYSIKVLWILHSRHQHLLPHWGTSWLWCHLQQMMFLEWWKSLSSLDMFLPSFNFGICFRFDRTIFVAEIPSSNSPSINPGLLRNCQKIRCNNRPFQFLRQMHHHTSPELTSAPFFWPRYKWNLQK